MKAATRESPRERMISIMARGWPGAPCSAPFLSALTCDSKSLPILRRRASLRMYAYERAMLARLHAYASPPALLSDAVSLG